MKKTLAFVLALAIVCSLSVAAFAAGSPVKEIPTPAYFGPALKAACPFSYEGNEAKDVIATAVDKADALEAADKEAFLAAYEAAKAITGKVVVDFFWVDADYAVDADHPLVYSFECKGENVQVQVNGKDMEVVETADNTYSAKLTELGAVAILCDAE